jgi:hypothetical protein
MTRGVELGLGNPEARMTHHWEPNITLTGNNHDRRVRLLLKLQEQHCCHLDDIPIAHRPWAIMDKYLL